MLQICSSLKLKSKWIGQIMALVIKFMNYIRNFAAEQFNHEDPYMGQPTPGGLERIHGWKQQFSTAKGEIKRKFDSPTTAYDQYMYGKAQREYRPNIDSNMDKPFSMFQTPYQGEHYFGQKKELDIELRHKNKKLSQQYYNNRTDINRGKDLPIYDYSDQEVDFSFPDPYIKYKIIPAENEKMAMDVTTIQKGDLVKGNVIIWDYHGGPNQHFYLKRSDNNKYYKDGKIRYNILSASTGFAVQVPDHSGKLVDDDDRAILETSPLYRPELRHRLVDKDGPKRQQWILESVGKDLFTIQSSNGTVLDVSNMFLINGNPVIHYPHNKGRNQKWRIWPS